MSRLMPEYLISNELLCAKFTRNQDFFHRFSVSLAWPTGTPRQSVGFPENKMVSQPYNFCNGNSCTWKNHFCIETGVQVYVCLFIYNCKIALLWMNENLCLLLSKIDDIDGLVQDCSNSSALAMELLHSYTKPSIYYICYLHQSKMHCRIYIFQGCFITSRAIT